MVTVSSNIPLRVITPRPEKVVVCLFVFLNIRHRETNVTGTTPLPFHDFFFLVWNFSISGLYDIYIYIYIYIYIKKSGGLLKKQRCVFNAKTSPGGRFKGSFVGTVLAAETLRF